MFSAALISLLLFNSCSKDQGNPSPNVAEKKMSVEISYNVVNPELEFNMGIGLVGTNVENTEVSGYKWSNTEKADQTTKIFGDTDVQSFSEKFNVKLKTSEPVRSVSVALGFSNYSEVYQKIPVMGTIKYYVEDKLIKTDQFIPAEENDYRYTQMVFASDGI